MPGARQEFTLLRITEILTDGKAPTKVAAEAKPRKPAAVAKDETAGETESAKPAAAKPARKPRAKAAPKAKQE